ncbi:hypothetical protein [Arcicella lustrica]|uniref:Uncharacterized protein n=2 Tax=Arcicella TaxID=217140 RepID=A0ABU5SMA9_9BACT|nr:hypothetical protein [Arcicella sp. DC25W]MEA5428431.1 hypothetical protein [Arcicella sp. DC25W]
MPPYYDIYGLSKQRDKKTIEKFLNHFSDRDKIEIREGQEIMVYKNEKYDIEETCISINTLTEVIDYGLKKQNHGFVFYISDNLKEEINGIILKFTFDKKIIFGVSIEEKIRLKNKNLIDNYNKALEIEKVILELTNASKTSIQFEYGPSDDEEEFDEDIEMFKKSIKPINQNNQMKENNKLAELTLEELLIKQKKAKGAVIGLGIVMAIALITLIYLAIKSKNYVLLAVAGGSGLTFLPSIIALKQIETEIKSRKS